MLSLFIISLRDMTGRQECIIEKAYNDRLLECRVRFRHIVRELPSDMRREVNSLNCSSQCLYVPT